VSACVFVEVVGGRFHDGRQAYLFADVDDSSVSYLPEKAAVLCAEPSADNYNALLHRMCAWVPRRRTARRTIATDEDQRTVPSWSTNPNIQILGNRGAWRLSIVSFIIKHKRAYLHHNFVVARPHDEADRIELRRRVALWDPILPRILPRSTDE
jgi:hypothetical protein